MKKLCIIPMIFIFYFSLLWGAREQGLFAQNKNIDSLLTLLKTDKPDTNKVYHLSLLTQEYELTGDFEKAIIIGTEELELSQILNSKRGITDANNNLGNIYRLQASYPKALEYYLAALKVFEEAKNKRGIAVQLGNIGIVYKTQSDYTKALDYYFKALKIAEELGDKKRIAIQFCNIGVALSEQANYSKALDYYFRALKIAEELGDKNGIASVTENIGGIYDKLNNYPNALEYYLKAMKIYEGLGDKYSITGVLSNLGALYTHTKNYKEAEKYLMDALKLNKEIGAMDDEKQIEIALSELYDISGNQKLALVHYKKAMALKDSIFSQENKKQLVRKEMNFEFDKKETAAKALQDKKDAVTSEEKQKQRVIIYSISFCLFLVVLLAIFIFNGYHQKRKANSIITQQKVEVEKQKELVEKKNKEITDSINYAKRIQQAKLPKKEEIYATLPQSFVLFKPKDIVSGDFYFFHKAPSPSGRAGEELVFIAAADCTGHGVPGAFMSMIGSEKLEDAVLQNNDTSEILKQLNKGIKTSLRQSDNEESTKDGMDIALCSINTENYFVKYAGANRPLWIIRHEQKAFEEIKPTKKAIGGFTKDNQHFDSQEIKLQKGDTFYIFTDGYADQFGGEQMPGDHLNQTEYGQGKKLMTKKFKEILLNIQDKTMQEQEKYLNTFIDNWRGNIEQIDDILVIGIRI